MISLVLLRMILLQSQGSDSLADNDNLGYFNHNMKFHYQCQLSGDTKQATMKLHNKLKFKDRDCSYSDCGERCE